MKSSYLLYSKKRKGFGKFENLAKLLMWKILETMKNNIPRKEIRAFLWQDLESIVMTGIISLLKKLRDYPES